MNSAPEFNSRTFWNPYERFLNLIYALNKRKFVNLWQIKTSDFTEISRSWVEKSHEILHLFNFFLNLAFKFMFLESFNFDLAEKCSSLKNCLGYSQKSLGNTIEVTCSKYFEENFNL